MRKTIFSLIFGLLLLNSHAQKKISARFEHVFPLSLAGLNKAVASSDKSGMLLYDSAASTQMMHHIFGESPVIKMESTFIIGDTIIRAESQVIEVPEHVTISMTGTKYYSKNSKWYKYNEDSSRYMEEKSELRSYNYTGNKKVILGYTCYEAKSKADPAETVWICKELPEAISPFILTKEKYGAILEYKSDSVFVHATNIASK